MTGRSEWNDPPLHQKVEIAISAAGWVLACAMAVGTAAWFRGVRRVVREASRIA